MLRSIQSKIHVWVLHRNRVLFTSECTEDLSTYWSLLSHLYQSHNLSNILTFFFVANFEGKIKSVDKKAKCSLGSVTFDFPASALNLQLNLQALLILCRQNVVLVLLGLLVLTMISSANTCDDWIEDKQFQAGISCLNFVNRNWIRQLSLYYSFAFILTRVIKFRFVGWGSKTGKWEKFGNFFKEKFENIFLF